MTTIKEIVSEVLSDLHLTKEERRDTDEIQSLLKQSKYDFPNDRKAYPLVANFFDIFYRAYDAAWNRWPNPDITEKGLVRIVENVEKLDLRKYKKNN